MVELLETLAKMDGDLLLGLFLTLIVLCIVGVIVLVIVLHYACLVIGVIEPGESSLPLPPATPSKSENECPPQKKTPYE